MRREAVLSSRIEGTQATLGELLAAEAGVTVERSPADLREVANYVVALEYGLERVKKLPLSLRLMRELHAKLMTRVRGDRATPGAFRRTQNWIGPPGATLTNATYVPPPPGEMMDCLGVWEEFLHDTSLPPLIQVALEGTPLEAVGRQIFEDVIAVASGKKSRSELSGVGEEEFAPWIIGPVM